ncbi:hypothetical protein D0T53_04240 [Dysgonomonas sp. 216]|uniref:RHS repeat-associated core domain-containing protein n=1 Tax=Dysgonomonas sp. 216 TaxID=2302934 RepID=UPI0013D41699|nr:RHS repeat-associated core domain-containing protein [Dysgonomonas sp. 216]NDW18126.1 hypothetical protein [Dysgonomonas sp. 216]
MKKIIITLFIGIILSINIHAQMTLHQIATIPVEQKELVLDSIKDRLTDIIEFTETANLLSTNYIANETDSVFFHGKNQAVRSISTLAASINTSSSVGEIAYTSGVSPNGASYINVPIELPKAPIGLTPELAFTYNSFGKRNDMGYGWSLSGISTISRTNKDGYYDNLPIGMKNDYLDVFSLDGLRLIRKTFNIREITYITESGNIKVTGYPKTINSIETISHFEVKYPNGVIAIYGFNNESIPVTDYPITKMTDIQGNSITYTYDYHAHNGYHRRILGITYGKNNEYQVEIKYRGTGSVGEVTEYIGGNKLLKNAMISYVNVKYNSNQLKSYILDYSTSETRLLNSIGLSDGSNSMNTLNFYYGISGQSHTFKNNGSATMPYWYNFTDPASIRIQRGKFEYGAQDDGIIMYPNKAAYYEYKKGSTNYIANQYTGNEDIIISSGLDGTYSMPYTNLKTGVGFIDVLCANLDEYEDEEIIKINNYVSGSYDKIDFHVYTADLLFGLVRKYSRSFQFPLIDYQGVGSVTPKCFYAGDFNGDGKTEILVISSSNTMGKGNPTKVYLFDLESNKKLYEGSPFNYFLLTHGVEEANRDQATIINNSDELFIGDFNGVGKSDLCLIGASNTKIFSFNINNVPTSVSTITSLTRNTYRNRYMMSGDFNGDGKTDLILAPPLNGNTTWKVYYSTGKYQFDSKDISISNAYNKDKIHYSVQDLNRDGATELTKTDQSVSTNTTFNSYIIFNGKYERGVGITLTKNSLPIPINIQSTNEFTSLLVISPSGGKVARYNYNFDYAKANIITSFSNSFGVTTSFNYNRLNEKINGTNIFFNKGTDAEFPFYNYADGGFLVTTALQQKVNNTLVKNISYIYSNAVIHKKGLGFCGFQKVSTQDKLLPSNNQIDTYDPYQWGILKNKKSGYDNIYDNTYEYDITVEFLKNRSITLKKKTEKDLLHGFTVTSTYTYDTFENPLTEIVNYGNGIIKTNTKIYNSFTGTNLYYLNEVAEESEKSECNGITIINKKVLSYNTYHQPLSVKSYVNDNLVMEVANTYSNKELTESRQKPYTSPDWLITQYTYDDNGRIKRVTDPMGRFKESTYNMNGTLQSVKDHKGLETSYTYDTWGRLLSETSPDGRVKTTSRNWSTSTYGLICITETETASPTTKKYFDALGRVIRSSEIRFDGKELKTDYQYDNQGRLYKTSIPFTGTTASLWNSYVYDEHNRTKSLNYASGKKDTYSYNKNVTTSLIDSISETKTVNQLGQIISLVDMTGTVTYQYRPDGQLTSTTAAGVSTTFEYDKYGRKTAINDPSAGRRTFGYDSSGNINKETDARGKIITMTYDTYNRLKTKTIDGVTTTHTYNGDGLLSAVSSSNGTSRTVTYDPTYYYKIKTEKETIADNKWMEKSYNYNATDGVLASITYKSSEASANIGTESYTYQNGHLKAIAFAGTTVWRLDAENNMGIPSQVTTGGLTRIYGYDAYGMPVRRVTRNTSGTAIQHVNYSFNPRTGNLTWRKDSIRNKVENFGYDKMNRLTTLPGKTVTYANNGNILGISTVGAFAYNTSRPYAIAEFTPSGTSQIPLRDQTIAYNTMMRPTSITENNYVTTLAYNSDGQRTKMNIKKSGTDELTRYYLDGGRYEIDKAVAGNKERLYLGGDAYSAAAVYVKEGNTWAIYYICRDYLGSITHVANASGAVRQELSYDAWGRLRNPANQTIYTSGSEPVLLLGRGYTGHEHLTMYGLINMNARLYDPVLGRFLSPDPYVQDPYNSQNFNRYSYCLNNPLKYNDPNGELFKWIWGGVSGFWKGVFRGKNIFKSTWQGFSNAVKIDWGAFKGDPKQIISRFTWELPQTLVGNSWSHARNIAGYVDQVKYYNGATFVINDNSSNYDGVTLGNYINMNIRDEYTKDVFEPSWNGGKFTPVADDMMMHEYGHYLQSQMLGLLYLPTVGAPSLLNRIGWIGTSDKNYFYTEKWANDMAYDYFARPSIPKGFKEWNFNKYPVNNPSNIFPWIYDPINNKVVY